jgi:ABC-2 type transport system permease protein
MNAIDGPVFSPWRAYALEARYEFLRLLRTPSFALPVLLFPVLFYLLFGVLLDRSGSGDAARYLLATYGVFGGMGVGLFGFGVTVAMERERGLLIFKRALPMPRGAYLFAKMVMAAIFAAMVSVLLAVLAATLGGVSLQAWQWLALSVVSTVGVLPFCAIGLFIGAHVGGQGSPAVVNLVYLPMSFLSGLWLPLKALPAWLSAAAPVWPSYHAGQVALKVVGMDGGGAIGGHLAVLAVVMMLFFALAWRRLARA